MKYLLKWLDLFLYTYLFTACCSTGLCMATEKLIVKTAPAVFSPLHAFVFGSTLFVYNTPPLYNKFANKKFKNEFIRLPFIFWKVFFFFFGFLLTLISFSLLPYSIKVIALVLSLFTFAYYLPLLPFKVKKRLRDFGWLKIIDLAVIWTIATSVLPILYLKRQISDFPIEITFRFIFLFSLCILFDIRDMQTDVNNEIYTLPYKIGLKKSYLLISLFMIAFVLLSLFQFLRFHALERVAGATVTAIVMSMVISYLKKNSTDRAYLAMADGMMLFYSLIILLW